MTKIEAEEFIRANIAVTRQTVTVMKALILKHFDPEIQNSITAALKELNVAPPPMIVLHRDVDPLPGIQTAVSWISHVMAGAEAVASLIQSGVLVESRPDPHEWAVELSYTTVHGKSGGESARLTAGPFPKITHPLLVRRSYVQDDGQILADSDLYLQHLDLPHLPPEIELALRQAVQCFRAELFTPAIVMLGKASEGTWIELGLAVARLATFRSDAKAIKLREALESADVGFTKKIRDTISMIESRQDALKMTMKSVGVSLDDLRLAVQWSELLREARNAVHHNSTSTIPHTYETTSVLFLAAAPHLRMAHVLRLAFVNLP